MGEEAWRESLQAERERNLRHNLKVLAHFAKLAAGDDPDYWRSYVEFINAIYRYHWQRLEDPTFKKAYMEILQRRKNRKDP